MNDNMMRCLVEGCDWSLDATPPNVPEAALASVFGHGVMAATAKAQHIRQVEDDCRKHLEGHPVDDWVRTVQSLRELAAGLTASLGEMSHEMAQAQP